MNSVFTEDFVKNGVRFFESKKYRNVKLKYFLFLFNKTKQMTNDFGYKISDFSKHLFWDVDRASLDFEKHKKLIIANCLMYGLWRDWEIIKCVYGLVTIAEVACTIKELDDKTRTFISTISGIPQEKFICYNTKPLNQRYWNF